MKWPWRRVPDGAEDGYRRRFPQPPEIHWRPPGVEHEVELNEFSLEDGVRTVLATRWVGRCRDCAFSVTGTEAQVRGAASAHVLPQGQDYWLTWNPEPFLNPPVMEHPVDPQEFVDYVKSFDQ